MKTVSIFFKTTLLVVAVSIAAVNTPVVAQTATDYNKRELIWQTLDQSRPNDYVPVFFNIHFKAHEGWEAV